MPVHPMAFFLTEDELERAKRAIKHHGYSVFFPEPPEWTTVLENWDTVRAQLASEDLDQYRPHEPLRSFAPKSRINLRPVTLLHPFDLLIYAALVLIVRDDLEAQRDPLSEARVFSHRSTPALVDALYAPTRPVREAFIARQMEHASDPAHRIVAVTDIADFFPRVYQHRLENIIRAASTARGNDVARVLVKKFLLNISGGDSYGLPVGPLASSLLAEAILIDVDAALIDHGFTFVRWFDDYTFFVGNESEAQRALFFLAKWLYDNHGLGLSTAKTKVLRRESFLKGISRDYEERIKERSEELAEIWASVSPYGGSAELDDEQKAQVERLNLASLLEEALDEPNGADYEFADLILGKLAPAIDLSEEQAIEIVEVVIKRIPDLYPIISSAASFFRALELDGLTPERRDPLATALLEPLLDQTAPDFVAMWVLHIFASSDKWNHAQEIRRIFSAATSPVVKRYAALALAVNGQRSHALATRDDLGGAKPMVRTAILRAWGKLGPDERKHWRQMAFIDDSLEKLI